MAIRDVTDENRLQASNPSPWRQVGDLASTALGAVQDEHDAVRSAACPGVTSRGLGADNDAWEEIGAAVAALARLISIRCSTSRFCSARPRPEPLAARISEAIDDQIDAPAWRVIDAAARLGSMAGG